jgi:anti-sigma factor RsiW
MTQVPGPHLSPDDIDRWLDGTLPAPQAGHLDACQECLELVRAEREMAEQIALLPMMAPTAGFADRVMLSVHVPDPFAIRSMGAARRRLFATRRSLAVAASLAVLLLGSMAGSIVWTMSHQDTLASIGSWLMAQGAQAAWLGLRGLATNVIEQPWYEGAKGLVGNPTRLAVASGVASVAYLGGVFALRRLLALPTQRVAHAGL